MPSITWVVPIDFAEAVDGALVRVGYLYPDLRIEWDSSERSIAMSADEQFDENALKKEVMFQIYREKIYRDTKSIRTSIYQNG